MNIPNLNEKADSMGIPSLDRTTTAIFSSAFTLATVAQLNQAQISLFGYDLISYLTSQFWALGSLSISWASVISVLAIIAVYTGNNRDITSFSDHQSYLGTFLVFAVIAMAISPDLTAWLSGTVTKAAITTVVLFLGFVSVAEFGSSEFTEAMN